MKLFSKEIDKKLFSQYSKGSDLDNQVVVTKIFNPYGNGRWFLLNSDPQEPDYLWAIVQMGDVVEMGSVLRSELESVRVSPFRFPLERDLSFRMVNAGELFRGLQEGKFYKTGGFVNGYAKGGELNLGIRKIAEQEGFTPKQLGKDYELVMAQAIVESLTDANFHNEARKLISLLENKPEWENKPEYGTKEYEKWEKSGVYNSKYWDANEKTRDFAIKVSQKSGWDGYAIASAFEYLVRIDGGYHKLADKIEKAMESNEEMAEGGEVVEYKTIASFDDSSIIIYDGNLGYSDILKLTNKLPKKLKIIQVVLKDSNSLNALTEWSKKQVKKTFNSDFEEGFPIIYSIKEKGEINIQNAYGELKNGKKVIFDVDGLTWEEGEIEMKDGGKLIGNQKKLDVNKNGKLDAQDFKILRGKMAKGGKVKKDFKVGDKVIYAPNGKWFVRNNLRNFKKGEITNVEVISGTKNYTVEFKNQYGEIINTLETYNTKELELDPDIEMAMGGETKFKDKVQSIKASLLKRKKVSPSVQKDYGKTYSPKEAKESAQRITGSIVSKMKEKVAKSNKK